MTSHGLPCWYELATTDDEAVKAFYTKLLGWSWADSGTPGMNYQLASAGDTMVAGLFPAEPGMPVAWSYYIAVDSADETVAQAASLGATVLVPPADIPNTGRFAVLLDPQGAGFAILQPLPGGTGGAFDQAKMGHGNWHDLSCPDSDAALQFYGALFGWSVSRSMTMGPEMIYNVIACNGQDIGGVFSEGGDAGPAHWCVYFGMDSVLAAVKTVTANGGRVLHDPAEVPGGAMIIHCTDPAGATFALVGPA